MNRGGGWFYGALLCRTPYRNYDPPAFRDHRYFGFRLVLSALPV